MRDGIVHLKIFFHLLKNNFKILILFIPKQLSAIFRIVSKLAESDCKVHPLLINVRVTISSYECSGGAGTFPNQKTGALAAIPLKMVENILGNLL